VRTPKVRLYIRVRLPDGRHAYHDPVWNRNRTLREGYAVMDGRPDSHPEGVYYLRFLRGRKRIREAVGSNADAAIAELRNKELDLRSTSLRRSTPGSPSSPAPGLAPSPAPASPAEVSFSAAVDAYVSQLGLFRAKKTVREAKRILELFGKHFSGKAIHAITREDLLDHMASLQKDGLGLRTISNHITRIGALLRRHKIVDLLSNDDKPKYDEREVEAYDSDQLTALFAAATAEERMLFQFFLGTGLREQEVMFCSWKNVDFNGKVITVKSKPELGFRPKDKQERSVPVPDSLIASLAKRRNHSTSMLVFPGPNGKPNGHFLRMLQKLAHRAGLNCSECLTKAGKSCAIHSTCGEWGLHKFRKTFATMHSEAGVPAPTIQRWLGHASLSTTLRYLAAADLRSERTRSQVNASFAALGIGGAA
jgi:integrase/recombinase XerD